MAHLRKLPTYFVKDGDRRAAFYTVQARELIDAGYTEEGAIPVTKIEKKTLPEIIVEVGQDAYDNDSIKVKKNEDLEDMTKAELLAYAFDRGHDLKNNLPKAEILEACQHIREEMGG